MVVKHQEGSVLALSLVTNWVFLLLFLEGSCKSSVLKEQKRPILNGAVSVKKRIVNSLRKNTSYLF